MLRPGQKSVDTLRHVIQKLATPGSIILDPCFGTGSTAKAFLMEPKYRKFNECQADSNCVSMMKILLLQVFASQVSNEESDIIDD